jgi:hypothetical protein
MCPRSCCPILPPRTSNRRTRRVSRLLLTLRVYQETCLQACFCLLPRLPTVVPAQRCVCYSALLPYFLCCSVSARPSFVSSHVTPFYDAATIRTPRHANGNLLSLFPDRRSLLFCSITPGLRTLWVLCTRTVVPLNILNCASRLPTAWFYLQGYPLGPSTSPAAPWPAMSGAGYIYPMAPVGVAADCPPPPSSGSPPPPPQGQPQPPPPS